MLDIVKQKSQDIKIYYVYSVSFDEDGDPSYEYLLDGFASREEAEQKAHEYQKQPEHHWRRVEVREETLLETWEHYLAWKLSYQEVDLECKFYDRCEKTVQSKYRQQLKDAKISIKERIQEEIKNYFENLKID